MCRESRTTHTYDTGILDLFDDLFFAQRRYIVYRCKLQRFKLPVILDHDRVHHVSYCNTTWLNCLNRAGNCCINRCRYETACLSDHLSLQYSITYCNHWLCRCTNVL